MKKYLLTFILSVAGLCMACADDPVQGIIATYEGSTTSYKLESMPTVKYETVEGVQHAVLYLKDKAEPVLSVALAEGKKLTVAYGEYMLTGIDHVASDKAHITVRHGKKYISGGRLIIIDKIGKMYDAAGTQLNSNF